MKTKLTLVILVMAFVFKADNVIAQQSFEQNHELEIQQDSVKPEDKKKKREQREKKQKKLQEMKEKFFNSKLSLTEAEKKKFWPLYNEYHKKHKKLNSDFRKKYKENDIIFMTDEQAEQYLKDFNKLKQDELDLMKEYQKKFKAFLPIKKVIMIYKVEKEFNRKILHTLYKKRGHEGGPDGQHPRH
jgi:Ni/Co efflux regulator RcnB